ncbi:MAG: RNA polymerase sigma factor, partial [Ktedonobacteraceae bacterium]
MLMQESGVFGPINDTLSHKQLSDVHQNRRGIFLNEHEAQFTAARPRLLRIARLRGVPPDAVEDVVQETLLEAWKHLDRLHEPAGFQRWLDEICRNICRRHARKYATDAQRSTLLPGATLDNDDEGDEAASPLNNLPDTQLPDPVEALSRQDLTTLLDRALGSLSDNAREAVELHYLLELPQREIAARLGLSLSALEARLHRARQHLRQVLNGPLRDETQAFGLLLDPQNTQGWQETRLWCMLCGQHRLSGLFLAQPDGSVNLHMQCPACEQRYGLSDLHSSNVHSKGLV